MTCSIVIPLYKAEMYLPALVDALRSLHERLKGDMEAVFVLDGVVDGSLAYLERTLPAVAFPSVLVTHSRNFGSLAAIRTGLSRASGPYFTMMSADLQEPPKLLLDMLDCISRNEADLVLGQRIRRSDPFLSQWMSTLFWALYRWLIQPEIPPGGVDVFACNQLFRDRLLALPESHNVMIGTLFWLGFRRNVIPYERQANRQGKSTWTFGRKIRYALDNVFLYSDFPVKLLTYGGLVAMSASGLSCLVWWCLGARISWQLTVIFMAGVQALGLGILGGYLWRILIATRGWPQAVASPSRRFPPVGSVSNDPV